MCDAASNQLADRHPQNTLAAATVVAVRVKEADGGPTREEPGQPQHGDDDGDGDGDGEGNGDGDGDGDGNSNGDGDGDGDDDDDDDDNDDDDEDIFEGFLAVRMHLTKIFLKGF